jgi:hypothetical protein
MKTTSLRKLMFYKKLTSYLAVAIAEGFCEGENATEEQQKCAWQYIFDKKLHLSLQGWFGRTCQSLLEQGVIEA